MSNKRLMSRLSIGLVMLFLPVFAAPLHAGDKFSDESFSLEFRDTEMRDVLRFIAKESGMNIVVPEGLTQKVSLSLDGVRLDDALEVILKSYGLGYVAEKGVVRITKSAVTTTDLQGVELVTEIIRLNYASASDLAVQLKGIQSEHGSVSLDMRSNSLIIRDTRSAIKEMKGIVKKLDYRVPQVLIKSRIVEASSSFSRNLGVQWGGQYVRSAAYGNALGADFPNSVSIAGGGGAGVSPGGTNYAVNLPAAGATSSLGLTFGSIKNNLTLDIQLSAAEEKGDVKIVSSPSITTVNNKPATISSGLEYRVRTSTIAGGAATTTGTEDVTAETSLTVTPQVSADGHILLEIEALRDELDFTREVDGIPGKIRKNAKTTVLVKDGDTTVIGGLYKTVTSDGTRGVPFLSQIPVLGWLFKSKNTVQEKEELLIFITPAIIKERS